MSDKILNSFDTWINAQGLKSRGRVKSVDNISLEGIARLRELILDLAVRGKLVRQNPSFEPAAHLLERITAEKNRLLEEGKLKKQKPLPVLTEEKRPFKLPDVWSFEYLQNTSHYITKGSTPTTYGHPYTNSGVRFVKVENISNGRITTDCKSQFIGHETHNFLERSRLEEGDLLFSIAGTIGRTCIVWKEDLPANTNQALAIIRGTSTVFSPDFLRIQFDSFVSKNTKDKARGGAMNNISLGDLNNLVVVIPPIEEQNLIVAKVDELMELCDELEQQTSNHLKSHQVLVKSLLATLTDAANPVELTLAWSRLEAHFDNLFTSEDSINQLKQTILQLAVMGKLVPQNPEDESASVLLEKISAEKKKLIEEGKIKKQKPLPEISEEEKPFELPEGWEWSRLQSLVYLLGDGIHGTPEYTDNTKYYFINGNNLNDGVIDIKSHTKTVSLKEMEKHKKDLNPNSVLVSINGTLGNVAFYNNEEIMLGKSACYFNLSPRISKLYVKRIIESTYWKTYAMEKATGSTIKNLGLKAMKEFPVPLPSYQTQGAIVEKIDSLFELCDNINNGIKKSQELSNNMATSILDFIE